MLEWVVTYFDIYIFVDWCNWWILRLSYRERNHNYFDPTAAAFSSEQPFWRRCGWLLPCSPLLRVLSSDWLKHLLHMLRPPPVPPCPLLQLLGTAALILRSRACAHCSLSYTVASCAWALVQLSQFCYRVPSVPWDRHSLSPVLSLWQIE